MRKMFGGNNINAVTLVNGPKSKKKRTKVFASDGQIRHDISTERYYGFQNGNRGGFNTNFQNYQKRKDHTVEIRHSSIVISNFERGDMVEFEHLFQIYDRARFTYKDLAMYIDPNENKLYIPSGIDYFFLEKYFDRDKIYKKEKPTPYKQVKQIRLSTKPRDATQTEAINFCIGDGKYTNNRRANQLFLNLNTGKGKTYVTIAVSAFFSVKTAIIMYAQSWIEQWKERILDYTDTNPKDIYVILGNVSIRRLLNDSVDHRFIKYYLISMDTLTEFAKTDGWNAVHDLFAKLCIGIKVYDEAHLRPENIMMIDFFTDVWKTYYVTATPMLSDPIRNKVYQRVYKTIPKITLFDKEADTHTDYLAILYNSHPSPVDLQNCRTNYGFNIIWYANYLPTRPNYYNVLKLILDEFILNKVSKDGKVLIYIGTNNAIMLTYNWIKYNYPFLDVGIFTTLVDKNEKRKQLEKKIILSTSKSAGVAVDIKGLEFTIDICEPGKSEVIVRQKLGRTRDQNTLFIDVVDCGFPELRSYYQQKQKIYKKYARNILDPIYLNDATIRDRLIDLRQREMIALNQYQQRENLKQVMSIRKPVMLFADQSKNTIQY